MSARTPKTSQWSRIRSNSPYGNLSHLRLLWCQRRLPQREALSESSKVAGAKVHGLHEWSWSIHQFYATLPGWKSNMDNRHSLDSRPILAPTKAPLKPVNLPKITMISCSKSGVCQTFRGFREIQTKRISFAASTPTIWIHLVPSKWWSLGSLDKLLLPALSQPARRREKLHPNQQAFSSSVSVKAWGDSSRKCTQLWISVTW